MLCSSAEIAEKKRIALEKLKSKKLLLNNTNNLSNSSNTSETRLSAANKISNGPVLNFYSSKDVQNATNKASSFLDSLKQLKDARKRAAPYQIPPKYKTGKVVNNINNTKESAHTTNVLAPMFVKTVKCDTYMVSDMKFAVKPSEYHTPLIEMFKTIPSKCYDLKTHIWSFSTKDYELLQERAKELKPSVVMGQIPKYVFQLFSKPKDELDYSVLSSLEANIAQTLLPFQKEGICFGISKQGRVLIADEMGLGKTYQALAIADFYREDWPLLICTTATTRSSWVSHVHSLFPHIACHHIVNLTSNQDYIGDARIVITSYTMMEKNVDSMVEKNFRILIMDESHTLKNNKAKCTIVGDRLSRKAKRIILLSGTPALSRPSELFSQLKMIDYKFINFMDFTTRYCDGKQTTYGWNCNGQSNLDELNLVLSRKFMIRRTKADVLPELVEKLRETVVLDSSLVLTNDNVKKKLNDYTLSLTQLQGTEREQLLFKYYAETAVAKAPAVCSYIKNLLKENIKFIIFAHHLDMIKAICECLKSCKTEYVKIDGSTRNDLRTKYVDEFQNNKSCQVAVLSLRSCNTGITLTSAQLIIFAELDWNPSTLAQAESRAHRIGQRSTVTCRYLMANNTADDIIWRMLKSKQDVLNKAGLFCEDLRNADTSFVPSVSGNIEKYIVKTPQKQYNENENKLIIEDPSKEEITQDSSQTNSLKHFLDDDNDDDFGNLIY